MPPRVTLDNLAELVDGLTTAIQTLVGPAGVGVSELGRVLIDGVLYTVKSARVRATASGNTQLIPAVGSYAIRLISYAVGPVSVAVTVTVQDAATTPVVMAGPWDCATNGGIVDSVYKESDQEGTVGQAVNVNLSGIANVTVHVRYIEKPV